jgi:hypothetical protein
MAACGSTNRRTRPAPGVHGRVGERMMNRFPDGKRFAFTIFDDTDNSTIDNVGPVYQLLSDLGLRTTKSVWPLAGVPGARFGGSTLQDAGYARFVRDLRNTGFEIALHNVRNSHSPRSTVELGFEIFREVIGEYPRVHANHESNRDNLYWGSHRLSASGTRLLYKLASRMRPNESKGHEEGSEFFWGDICREHIRFVRNFVFREINLDRMNPEMPYHDPRRPYVNGWFSSCEGGNVETFCQMISEANQDRLEEEGGVCIMYTHFASGFANGKPEPRFERLIRRMAKKNGWFVPVSTLLDHLANARGNSPTSTNKLVALERRWLGQKLLHGRS